MAEQHPERGPDLSSDEEITVLPQIERYVDEHVAPPFRQHMKEYLMVVFSSHFFRDRIIELVSKLNISTFHENDSIAYEAERYQHSLVQILEAFTGTSYQSFPAFMDALDNLYAAAPAREADEDEPNVDCFTRTAKPVSECYASFCLTERAQAGEESRVFAEIKWKRSDWLNALDGNGQYDAYYLQNFLEILYASCSGMNDTEYALTMEVPRDQAPYTGTYTSRNPVEQQYVRALGFERALEQSARAVYLGHGFGGDEQVLAEKAYKVAEVVGSLEYAGHESVPVADTVVLRSTDLGLGGFGQNKARREMLELLSNRYSIEENALKKVIDTLETIPVLRRKKANHPDYIKKEDETDLIKQIIYEWWSMGGATGAHAVAQMVEIQRQFQDYPHVPMTAILYSPIAHGSTESLASGFVEKLLWLNNVLGSTPGIRNIATRSLRELPTRYVVRWKMGAKTQEQQFNADQLAGVIARYPRDSYRLVRELSKKGGYSGVPERVAEVISEGSAHVIVVIGEDDKIVDPAVTDEAYRTMGDNAIQKRLEGLQFVVEGVNFGYEGAQQVLAMINDFTDTYEMNSEVSFLDNFQNFLQIHINKYKPELAFAVQLSVWKMLQNPERKENQLPSWFIDASVLISEVDTTRQLYKRGPVIGTFPNMPHSTIFDQNDVERYLLRVIPYTRPSDLRDILAFVEGDSYWSAAVRLATSVMNRCQQNPNGTDPEMHRQAGAILEVANSEGPARIIPKAELDTMAKAYLGEVFGPMLHHFRLPT